MKKLLFCLFLFCQTAMAQQLELTPDKWQYKEGKVAFSERNGTRYMQIMAGNQGAVVLKEVKFWNGTIEFDFEPTGTMSLGSSPTVYFRADSLGNNSEIFYIRARPSNPQANDAIQYAPILAGVNMWDMYPQFQGPAFFEANKSNHLKILVNGAQMRVYVNDMDKPALQIPKLEGTGKGTMIGIDGGMVVSNFQVKPDQVEDLPAIPGPDLTEHDANYIRQWRSTLPIDFAPGNEPLASNLPKSEEFTEILLAENAGLINLTRKFGANESRKLLFLKATIRSQEATNPSIQLGFSDEVWVFVNGQLAFLDKNLYLQPAMRKYPEGRISIQNAKFSLPLKQGENELIIAVANDFYGWGVIARLETMVGLEILK
ncbi:hypothetical protein U3A58_09705 [Algoriphagus sp. C2-6-M1]|uniref:hypothetical protein n=1 Tax=Algoriphagus persicinus TaxID=3108754 RepID=UPI002B3B4F9A|nr:hypothetical protein [Algoriphagus sp. C2-6-M1]MEB2780670.1 hypothetical protein [Algoriphagus sp. C2-6-M1]